jgi:hypothetical protein
MRGKFLITKLLIPTGPGALRFLRRFNIDLISPGLGAGEPVGNDIYFLLIGRYFISVELNDRQNVLSPLQNLRGLQNLLSVTRKIDKWADHSLFLNLLMADLIFLFLVDTTNPKNGLLVRCHCLRRAFRSPIKSLILSGKVHL